MNECIYKRCLISSRNGASIEDILKLESEYSVRLHQSHKDMLCSVNGGMCEMKDDDIVRILFFPVDDASPSSLGSMIYEIGSNNKIPIGETTNKEIIYMDLVTGSIIVNQKVVAATLADFFLTYCETQE